MTPIRVLVADDQALLRASFRILLDSEPDLITVGEAGTGSQAVTLARQEKPDVILMDIRMPMLDGIEATRQITSDPATTTAKVLILTTFDLDEYVFAALRAGASGFVLKDTPPDELLAAIRVIAAGDALLSPASLGGSLANSPAGPSRAALRRPRWRRSPTGSGRCSR
jgi:DNA-binding NarL/FixJ family response regulator